MIQSKSENDGLKPEEMEKIGAVNMNIMHDIEETQKRIMANKSCLEEIRNDILRRMHGDE